MKFDMDITNSMGENIRYTVKGFSGIGNKLQKLVTNKLSKF